MTPTTPGKFLWDRIDAAGTVRVASRQPRKRHPTSAQRAVQFDRLHRILRARRPIAARVAHPGRKREAIGTNRSDQNRFDHSKFSVVGRVLVVVSRPAMPVNTSCNNPSASARTWRRHALIASGTPCWLISGALSRSAMSIRAEACAAKSSKADARCRQASRTIRLTSDRSTERRALRFPTVTPKRTPSALAPSAALEGAVAHAAFMDNIWRSARIDLSRGARSRAENSAGVLSRRNEAKP